MIGVLTDDALPGDEAAAPSCLGQRWSNSPAPGCGIRQATACLPGACKCSHRCGVQSRHRDQAAKPRVGPTARPGNVV